MKIYKYTTSGTNLFDPSATDTAKGYINGNYLINDGTTAANVSWAVSEYIEIPAGTTQLTFTVVGNAPSVCFYDANKEFKIGKSYDNRTTFTFYTQNKYKYFRLSFYKPQASNFSVTSNALGWREAKGYQYTVGENLFDPTKYASPMMFLSGEYKTAGQVTGCAVYVPVIGGHRYTFVMDYPVAPLDPGLQSVFSIDMPADGVSYKINDETTWVNHGNVTTFTRTAPATANYMAIQITSTDNLDTNIRIYETEVKWRETTAHEYSSGSWD